MRPIDFCTPKQSNSSTPTSSLPGAAISNPCEEPLGVPVQEPLSYRALRLVLVHAKRLSSRSSFARPETREADTGWLGAVRCERGRGGSRFTTRSPLRRPFDGYARALSSPASDRIAASDTPVASSALVSVGRAMRSTLWLGGRRDRFRGGPVKGVRFPDPRCLPSRDTPCNPAAPKCGRTHDAFFDHPALT